MVGAILGAAVILTLMETLLQWRWVTLYCRFGIPIFRATVRSLPREVSAAFELPLEEQVDRLSSFPPLRFRRLSEHVVAFREGHAVGAPYLGARGIIEEDLKQGALHLTGFPDWTPCFLTIGFSALLFQQGDWRIGSGFAASTAFYFWRMRRRLAHVARELDEYSCSAWPSGDGRDVRESRGRAGAE